MIAVLPVGPFPTFPLVEFLTTPSGNQLEIFGYYIRFSIDHQQVDVIGGHHIIEYSQAEPFPCLKEPVIPTSPIPGKLQKEFFLMTAVRDVPHLSGNVMADLLVPFLNTRF